MAVPASFNSYAGVPDDRTPFDPLGLREAGKFVRRHGQGFAADILQGRYELRLQKDSLHFRCELFDDRWRGLGWREQPLPADSFIARDRFTDRRQVGAAGALSRPA